MINFDKATAQDFLNQHSHSVKIWETSGNIAWEAAAKMLKETAGVQV